MINYHLKQKKILTYLIVYLTCITYERMPYYFTVLNLVLEAKAPIHILVFCL